MKSILTIGKEIYRESSQVFAMIELYHQHFEQNDNNSEGALTTNSIKYNNTLWDKDVKLIRSLAPRFAKVYPLYWKNELVITKLKSKFER